PIQKEKEVMDNIRGCSNEIKCLGVVITTDKSQTVNILLLEFADVIKEPNGKGLTKIDVKFDVLAFGCIVFEILTDKQLWFSYMDLKFLGLKKRVISGMLAEAYFSWMLEGKHHFKRSGLIRVKGSGHVTCTCQSLTTFPTFCIPQFPYAIHCLLKPVPTPRNIYHQKYLSINLKESKTA
ncbi:mitogen-activated protein kinase kinase kinase 17-like protein, partial [Tanacetum coccineum]